MIGTVSTRPPRRRFTVSVVLFCGATAFSVVALRSGLPGGAPAPEPGDRKSVV